MSTGLLEDTDRRTNLGGSERERLGLAPAVPIEVEVKGWGVVEFPADTPTDEIKRALDAYFRPGQKAREGERQVQPSVSETQHRSMLDFARKRLADSPVPNLHATAIGLGASVASPIARMFGQGEHADYVNRFSAAYQQAAGERDPEGWVPPIIKRGARGVGQTVPTMIVAGRAGGPLGAIGVASLQEANRAITEGKDAGLTGMDLAKYVASQGVIEAVPALVMQRFGLGGFESIVGREGSTAIGKGLLDGLKRVGIQTVAELTEENVTEFGHNFADFMSGVRPNAMDPNVLRQTAADTTVQSAMGMGLVSSPQIMAATIDRIADLPRAPTSREWAKIVLGDAARHKDAPNRATRQQHHKAAKAAKAASTAGGEPEVTGIQPEGRKKAKAPKGEAFEQFREEYEPFLLYGIYSEERDILEKRYPKWAKAIQATKEELLREEEIGPALDNFDASDRGATGEYGEEAPGFVSLRLRHGRAAGTEVADAIQIVGVEVAEKGQGTFSRLLNTLKTRYKGRPIFVESVGSKHLRDILKQKGFRLVGDQANLDYMWFPRGYRQAAGQSAEPPVSPPAEAEGREEVKQPWEMSREEYDASRAESRGLKFRVDPDYKQTAKADTGAYITSGGQEIVRAPDAPPGSTTHELRHAELIRILGGVIKPGTKLHNKAVRVLKKLVGVGLFTREKTAASRLAGRQPSHAFSSAGEVEECLLQAWTQSELARTRIQKELPELGRAFRDANTEGLYPHRQLIEEAISKGKPVPPEVLADYPDLVPQKPGEEDRLAQAERAASQERPPAVAAPPPTDYSGMTVKELNAEIKRRHLKGLYRKRKAELVAALQRDDRMAAAIARSPETGTQRVTGYHTKLARPSGVIQRSAGKYIALDTPFQPELGDVSEVTIDIDPRKVFDPNGIMEGTNRDKSKDDHQRLVDELNRRSQEITDEIEHRPHYASVQLKSAKLRTEILQEMGYEAEAGWIDGPEDGNRELVVFDKERVVDVSAPRAGSILKAEAEPMLRSAKEAEQENATAQEAQQEADMPWPDSETETHSYATGVPVDRFRPPFLPFPRQSPPRDSGCD